MKDLFLLEKTNIMRSNRLVFLILSLLIISICSYIIYYLVEGVNVIGSINFLFDLSSQILFPIIFSCFIMLSYLSDFKNGNWYQIKLSSIRKENIFISKFTVNILFILLCLIFIVNLYVLANFIFYNKNYVFIEFLKFNILDVFIRVNLVTLCMYIYILCYCLVGIIFILILPKISVGIILISIFTVCQTIIPLPDNITKFLFTSSFNVHSAIQIIELPVTKIARAFFINIINAIILIFFSLILYSKRFKKEG